MQKISLHLGSTTFVADKEVLSKPLGVFQTHGALKSATSYNVKSNVQRHVFRVFLSACKSNILPQITPENREQMTQLCEEFQFEALRLFLNRADPKVPTFTVNSYPSKSKTSNIINKKTNLHATINAPQINHKKSIDTDSNDDDSSHRNLSVANSSPIKLSHNADQRKSLNRNSTSPTLPNDIVLPFTTIETSTTTRYLNGKKIILKRTIKKTIKKVPIDILNTLLETKEETVTTNANDQNEGNHKSPITKKITKRSYRKIDDEEYLNNLIKESERKSVKENDDKKSKETSNKKDSKSKKGKTQKLTAETHVLTSPRKHEQKHITKSHKDDDDHPQIVERGGITIEDNNENEHLNTKEADLTHKVENEKTKKSKSEKEEKLHKEKLQKEKEEKEKKEKKEKEEKLQKEKEEKEKKEKKEKEEKLQREKERKEKEKKEKEQKERKEKLQREKEERERKEKERKEKEEREQKEREEKLQREKEEKEQQEREEKERKEREEKERKEREEKERKEREERERQEREERERQEREERERQEREERERQEREERERQEREERERQEREERERQEREERERQEREERERQEREERERQEREERERQEREERERQEREERERQQKENEVVKSRTITHDEFSTHKEEKVSKTESSTITTTTTTTTTTTMTTTTTTTTKPEVLASDILNVSLSPIQRMALNLQRALFGTPGGSAEESKKEEEEQKGSSTASGSTQQGSDSNEAASFKVRVARLEYFLYGKPPPEGMSFLSLKNKDNDETEERVKLTPEQIYTKRAPRHVKRRLPSRILKDD